MVYSATVSQLINSIESHSITFDGHSGVDSIATRSISNSANSAAHSAASCKSISEPAVLFSKAVLDLKRAAREESGNRNAIDGLTEYWDTWNYWKKHPFVIGNDLLSGQLLSEHLLILTNIKYEGCEEIFQDLKQWLQQTAQNSQENVQENQCNAQDNLIQLRDQLCAGFFLIFCSNPEISADYLEQVKDSLVPEYFEALKSELKKREQDNKIAKDSKEIRSYSQRLQVLFLFLKEIALNLLEKIKTRHALFVALIKSNTKNFLLFCKNLLQVILRKLKLL